MRDLGTLGGNFSRADSIPSGAFAATATVVGSSTILAQRRWSISMRCLLAILLTLFPLICPAQDRRLGVNGGAADYLHDAHTAPQH